MGIWLMKEGKNLGIECCRLQSFLGIRWIRQIRGAFTLSIFGKWPRLFPHQFPSSRRYFGKKEDGKIMDSKIIESRSRE